LHRNSSNPIEEKEKKNDRKATSTRTKKNGNTTISPLKKLNGRSTDSKQSGPRRHLRRPNTMLRAPLRRHDNKVYKRHRQQRRTPILRCLRHANSKKGGDPGKVKGWRPTTLSSVLGKPIEGTIATRIARTGAAPASSDQDTREGYHTSEP